MPLKKSGGSLLVVGCVVELNGLELSAEKADVGADEDCWTGANAEGAEPNAEAGLVGANTDPKVPAEPKVDPLACDGAKGWLEVLEANMPPGVDPEFEDDAPNTDCCDACG